MRLPPTAPPLVLPVLLFAVAAGCTQPSTCAPEGFGFPLCYGGVYTCSFGELVRTSESCDGGSTRAELYQAICETGQDVLLTEVDPQIHCDAVLRQQRA